MFTIAVLIGIYSYVILTLGLLGILYKSHIAITTIAYILIIVYFIRNLIKRKIVQYLVVLDYFSKPRVAFVPTVSILIFALQAIVNFVGALGPELGFDALWYHLTLPKIYLLQHSIDFIPGGLLYYSAMPKLTEMLYVSVLSFGTETLAKLIHFSFGILSLIALYNLSRKFLSKTFSLLVIVVFYSNLVVGWMSITSYVDLARTFFEIMALWGFINWFDTQRKRWLIASAAMLGFAISAKLLAIGSLVIFTALIIFTISKVSIRIHPKGARGNSFTSEESKSLLRHRPRWFTRLKRLSANSLVYLCVSSFIPFPWFIFSFIHTGNPVYPFFTNIYPVKFNFNIVNPLNLSDPISPVYVIFLPLALFLYRKFKPALKLVALYCFLAIVVWYLTPQTGGGRFILPYLPAFSLISVLIISMIKKRKIQYILIWTIVFFAVFSIIYRSGANSKYIPVVLRQESKDYFLSNNLNFSYGDFYDTDGYFAKKIKIQDTVLLYGFHNLYYVNFPFVDSSYVKKGDMFNYIAVQGNNLPERFKFWNLIYYNDKTNVKVYSIGGLKWIY